MLRRFLVHRLPPLPGRGRQAQRPAGEVRQARPRHRRRVLRAGRHPRGEAAEPGGRPAALRPQPALPARLRRPGQGELPRRREAPGLQLPDAASCSTTRARSSGAARGSTIRQPQTWPGSSTTASRHNRPPAAEPACLRGGIWNRPSCPPTISHRTHPAGFEYTAGWRSWERRVAWGCGLRFTTGTRPRRRDRRVRRLGHAGPLLEHHRRARGRPHRVRPVRHLPHGPAVVLRGGRPRPHPARLHEQRRHHEGDAGPLRPGLQRRRRHPRRRARLPLALRLAMVVNASNRAKVVGLARRTTGSSARRPSSIRPRRPAMLAVQGPRALELCAGLFPVDLDAIRYYFAAPTVYRGSPCVVSRTGYTGEDGFEVMLPAALAAALADELVCRGARPCGLGARDTLRLEAAMPLYGHELTETDRPDPGRPRLGGQARQGRLRRPRRHRRPQGGRGRAPSASAWSWRAAGPPARGPRFRRGAGRRQGDQRHLHPDARQGHRHGLRRAGLLRRRHAPGSRGGQGPDGRPGRRPAFLPPPRLSRARPRRYQSSWRNPRP